MRPSTLAFALVALLLLPLLGASAGEEKEESFDPPTMDQAERIVQRFLRLKMGGNHAGGVAMRMGTLPDGRLLMTSRTVIQMTRSATGEDDVFTVEQSSTDLYDAEGSPLWSEEVSSEAGVVTTARATYMKDRVDVTVEGPGGTFRKSLERPDDLSSEYQVFQALRKAYASGARGAQVERSYSSLDASEMVFKPTEMTILERTTYEHGGRTVSAWKFKLHSEDVVSEGVAGDDYMPCSMSLMGGFIRATWVDEPPFEIQGGGFSISSMVEVDRAVPRAFDLEELEVRFVLDPPPPADAPPVFESTEYQTVVREADGYRMVLRGRRPPKDFEPPSLPVPTEDESIAVYLEATPQAQSEHAEIKAQARHITEKAEDALQATEKIVHWVWANVTKRGGARGSATAVEVLKSLEGDCTEHAVLTVALCRAVGIPARAIGGLVYVVTGQGKAFAGYHAWAEVWVGRWVPVDATIPEVGTSARYARIDIAEPGHPDRAGRMLTVIASKTRLEILAWKHYGGERVEAAAVGAAK